uniref:SAM-dependent MTase TRM10-type domain-containing protein n=1 Tax=Heterorhabditis bacteriophora TaxID=37862 RepID=A0A1I7WZV6_HETBA
MRRFLSIVVTPCHSRSLSSLIQQRVEHSESPVTRYLPSEKFLKKNVRNPLQRQTLMSLVLELQVFLEIFGPDSLPTLDDSMWNAFFKMYPVDERCEYLNKLRLDFSEVQNDKKDGHEKISLRNQMKYDNGEMVYAPGFHQLIDIRGQEFRKHIDRLYGSRLLSADVCFEHLPKLIVDCRFIRDFSVSMQWNYTKQIQAVHDNNWASRRPFRISIANFLPDTQLSDMIHDIIYVSWRAPQFLPELPPSEVRAVVICASNDYQPWSSSISAAAKDQIPVYRMPIERYVKLGLNQRRVLPLNQMVSILRSYFLGEDIGAAIRQYVIPKPNISREKLVEDRAMFDVRFIKCKIATNLLLNCLELHEFQTFKSTLKEILMKQKTETPVKASNTKTENDRKPERIHKYTREERKEMKKRKNYLNKFIYLFCGFVEECMEVNRTISSTLIGGWTREQAVTFFGVCISVDPDGTTVVDVPVYRWSAFPKKRHSCDPHAGRDDNVPPRALILTARYISFNIISTRNIPDTGYDLFSDYLT